MTADDFHWAARLMDQRRQRYAAYSPVFWRAATGITEMHAEFMRSIATGDGAVAVRSDGGFVLTSPHDGRCTVDDFAVERDELWESEGRDLLLSAWATATSPQQSVLRVVSARRDEPKRALLRSLGLRVAERWWVKELSPPTEAATWGPVDLGGLDALIGPAPPVYDPGGPVCLLGDIDSSEVAPAAQAAEDHGAVLAIVQREHQPPAVDDALEAAGFHHPSEFYEGVPFRTAAPATNARR